ncbi:hypothetical protein [Brunnivagina elsteri]|uniref:Uncharacterized protein n=1 Tax=Brunnivagina elsteri CCALA 953 TaxID=987040 RepID=A0A2A2TK91_9CYAN|nr:hypothetical protein [Calothrix elsteri]PAX56178.1 hypothetical protein CK510_10295 [Calothrix elsteri CCALA 953]
MAIIRQYIAPLLAVIIFTIALIATSARIFLPADMAAPAPVEEGVGFKVESNNSSLISFSITAPAIHP